MILPRIPVRKLIVRDPEELWDKLRGNFYLVYDDGEVHTNWKDAVLSMYHLQHFTIPEAGLGRPLYMNPAYVISKKFHFKNYTKNGNIPAMALTQAQQAVVYDIFDMVRAKIGPSSPDPNWRLVSLYMNKAAELGYRMLNLSYNHIIVGTEEYVTTIDPLDILGLMEYPPILKIKAELEDTVDSIADAYSKASKLLMEDLALSDNAAAMAVRLGAVNMHQALQMLICRGKMKEHDQHIWRRAITSSFMDGILTLRDSLKESASAARALYAAGADLQDSEYSARRLAIACGYFTDIEEGDCGSGRYLRWRVRGKRQLTSTIYSEGDLPSLSGKYYLNEETGKIDCIKPTDAHLIGKVLKIRSHFAGCYSTNPYGICSTCLGETYINIPPYSTLAPVMTTTVNHDVSQKILGQKHVDGSAAADGLSPSELELKYIRTSEDGSAVYICKIPKHLSISIRIKAVEVSGISDIGIAENVSQINASSVSEVTKIFLDVRNSETGVLTEVGVSTMVNNRLGMLTNVALMHIRSAGYRHTDAGFIEFGLEDWDFNDPMINLTNVHYNVSDYLEEILEIVESSIAKTGERMAATPAEVLHQLFDTLNSRMQTSLPLVELMLTPMLTVDPDNGDYSFPKPWTTCALSVREATMANRSIGGILPLEGQNHAFANPKNYLYTESDPPINHPMDVLICPDDYLRSESVAKQKRQHWPGSLVLL